MVFLKDIGTGVFTLVSKKNLDLDVIRDLDFNGTVLMVVYLFADTKMESYT